MIMASRTSRDANDIRRHLRVKDNTRVTWFIRGTDLRGQAKICNISSEGMLLAIREPFGSDGPSMLTFDSDLGHDNYIPRHAQPIWIKKEDSKRRYLTGVKFVEPTDYILSKLNKKIEKSTVRGARLRQVNKVLDGAMIGLIVALFGAVAWQWSSIHQNVSQTNDQLLRMGDKQAVLLHNTQQLYQENKLQLEGVTAELETVRRMYEESDIMLRGVRQELEVTQKLLTETETLLTQAKEGNLILEEVNGLRQQELGITRAELTNTVALLEERNTKLKAEMKSLEKQMRVYQGDVGSLDEGRSFVQIYRANMKKVKARIKHFKREAHETRKAAMRERDRIRMILGNNGFFVKDGSLIKVDQERFDNGVFQPSSSGSINKSNVTIDVKVFN